MSISHDRFVVRIRSSAGRVVGAGFLAGERLVITCAHVVAAATDADGDAPDLPSVDVPLDFPLLAPDAVVSARVIGWMPMSARGGDIAILEISDGLPRGASPATLVASTAVWGHAFRAFGFPAGHDDGVWAAGVLRDRQGSGWVQVDDVDEIGYRVQQGFSGGPVFDETLDGVVGMAVAADASPDTRSAWLIPTETLVGAWPHLATRMMPACPYPGLRSFRESDAATFYGRKSFVHDRLPPATPARSSRGHRGRLLWRRKVVGRLCGALSGAARGTGLAQGGLQTGHRPVRGARRGARRLARARPRARPTG